MPSDASRTLEIVNAVRKHKCLWDVNANDYNKREKLDKAWTAVAKEVGKSEVFCRDKWRNVRTGFLRSIQHQLRKSDDENLPKDFHTVKRKKFYLYNEMSFLLPSAESLEKARKKRKKSNPPKQFHEDEDMYDLYCDNSNTSYSIMEKREQFDGSEIDSIGDYAEKLQALETTNDCAETDEPVEMHLNAKNPNQKETQNSNMRLLIDNSYKTTEELSPTPRKIMRIIEDQMNESDNHLAVGNIPKTSHDSAPAPDITNSGREEEQLMYFFRGSIDDILALSKRKQRKFKKRMLDLIYELHDSESST